MTRIRIQKREQKTEQQNTENRKQNRVVAKCEVLIAPASCEGRAGRFGARVLADVVASDAHELSHETSEFVTG